MSVTATFPDSRLDRRDVVIMAVFFLQALAGGGIFSRLADIQQSLNLTESQLGFAIAGTSGGGLVTVLFAGRLVARSGARPVLILSMVLETVMSLAVALAPSFALLILAFIGHGVAFSFANVAMNIEAGRVELLTRRRIMNRCHGLWGLGMLAAALAGVAARAGDVSAPMHFALIAGPVSAMAILTGRLLEPGTPPASPPRFARPTRSSWTLMLFGLSAGVAQIGTQSWSVIYMRDTFRAPAWLDTLTLPAFLLAMSLGRLFADSWTARHGAARVASVSTLAALAGTLTVIFAQSLWPALAGFAVMGIGGAVLYPLMVSAAASVPGRPPNESVSSVILLFGIALLIVPPLMGGIAQSWGLRAAFAAILPSMLVTLALARHAEPSR